MNVQYRALSISDRDALLQLWRSCDGIILRDADSQASMEKYLQRNPGLSRVATVAGAIVGSLMAGHDGRRGYLQHLAVAPAQRRQGIGACLLDLCLEALKQQGIIKSHVHVIQSNRSGIDFWSRRGWIHRAEIEIYSYVNGEDSNA